MGARALGNERWADGGGRGGGKHLNDFLLALRLFLHLTAWTGPWRDGLEQT